MIKRQLLIIAHNNLGHSLSGGDQIFLNLIKHAPDDIRISFVGSQESLNLLKKSHLQPACTHLSAPLNPISLNTLNLFLHQIKRLFFTFKYFFTHLSLFSSSTHIYTASDFPSDAVYGILTKIFFPGVVWIAGFYLFAPNPTSKNSPYLKIKQAFRGWIYFLGQLPIYFSIKILADFVTLTSDPDIKKFPQKKCLVIQGGVYLPNLRLHHQLPVPKRKYDAVFLGRLHLQKGILELVDIWKIVVGRIPQASLAIIGDGELKKKLLSKIRINKLHNNIHLLGFLTGTKKYHIFNNSKIVVHPASYDSGGMAAAEAMAWGLPGVSFDLEALKTYYPQGMIKTKCFDTHQFAQNIIKLLTKKTHYQKTSLEAITLTHQHWSWPQKLAPLYRAILTTP